MSGWGAGLNPPGGPVDPSQSPVRVAPFSEPVRINPPAATIATAVRAIDVRSDERVSGLRAELDNMYPLLTAAERKNAQYAHELDLLRQERDSLELERDCALLEVSRLEDRVHDLQEWVREPAEPWHGKAGQ